MAIPLKRRRYALADDKPRLNRKSHAVNTAPCLSWLAGLVQLRCSRFEILKAGCPNFTDARAGQHARRMIPAGGRPLPYSSAVARP